MISNHNSNIKNRRYIMNLLLCRNKSKYKELFLINKYNNFKANYNSFGDSILN